MILFVFIRFTKILAVVYLLIITIYHMINNRWANYINQSLAVIKLITYSIIALAGIYRLTSNWSVSRFNWEHPINGDTTISAYSSSILLVSIHGCDFYTVVLFVNKFNCYSIYRSCLVMMDGIL